MNLARYTLTLLIVAAAYYGAAEVGLSQAFLHPVVSPVWPPTGLAIAAVWWLGYRISPAILVGAFLVNLANGASVATAVGIAAGNTLEAAAAAFFLHRIVGLRTPFYRAQDAVRFVLIAGVLSTAVSATIGNISLCLGGEAPWEGFGARWITWWLGDGVGALVVAPLLLTWAQESSERWPARRLAEAGLLFISLCVVAYLLLGGISISRVVNYSLWCLNCVLFLWAAFRFGSRGVATTVALFSGIAVWETRKGYGPFTGDNPNESLLLLQILVATVAVTFLVLAAIVEERKQAHEALLTKGEQLRLITDITPVMLAQCSRDLHYRFVNRAYAETFGLEPEQVVGRPIREIVGDDAYDTILPYIKLVLEGRPVEYEEEIPYRRVGRRNMHVTYMPDYDERGRIAGWVASLSDITNRNRAEEQVKTLNAELQRRVEEFQALIDTAPVGIGVAMDPACSYIWGNPEFAQMLSIDPKQNISKSGPAGDELPFRVFRNGQEVPADDLPMQRVCRLGIEVLDEELEIVHSDGKIIHELCHATPLRDERGNVRGCVGVFLDITERKRTEEALRQSEERFAKAFKASPLALTITSLKTGRLLEVNETFTRLSGYTRDEAVGRTTLELGLWSRESDREAELAIVSRRGNVRDLEYRFRMKDGTELTGLLSAETIEIGDEPCALTVIKDITEQKQAEAERELLLLREQAARAEAEAANRAKDEFLATLSHELRTPLNAIMGWTNLLRSGRIDEQTGGYALEVVERNARAQAKLIEDILDASRIITGKLNLEFHPVDLTPVINAAIDVVSPTADAKNIGLECSIDPHIGAVLGDPARLQQTIWNLLSNALKFTPAGGRVRLEANRAGDKARISVSDTGEGISTQFLPYVFDRFQQADSSRTRKHSGLGLGLAIARYLVEAHAGTIEAHSEGKGLGSTFVVSLPLTVEASDFEIADTNPHTGSGDTLPGLDGVRLLIVEDDPDSLEVLRAVVELHGAETKAAARTSEALELLDHWIPDALISDIGLPDEDGYALIGKVRIWAREKGIHLPAIALTGYAGEEEGQRALASGFQMYLTKPAEPATLIEAISSLVRHDGQRLGA